jgi:hypothetical protein
MSGYQVTFCGGRTFYRARRQAALHGDEWAQFGVHGIHRHAAPECVGRDRQFAAQGKRGHGAHGKHANTGWEIFPLPPVNSGIRFAAAE